MSSVSTSPEALEFVRHKMQRPIYTTENGRYEERQIGSTNIVATHGMSIQSMARLATTGEFSGNNPALRGHFFLTPNLRNKAWRRSEHYDELLDVAEDIDEYDVFDISEIYADTPADDDSGLGGGFVLAFNSKVLQDCEMSVGFDAVNNVPEITRKPAPRLDAIFKIYPIDDQSVTLFEKIQANS